PRPAPERARRPPGTVAGSRPGLSGLGLPQDHRQQRQRRRRPRQRLGLPVPTGGDRASDPCDPRQGPRRQLGDQRRGGDPRAARRLRPLEPAGLVLRRPAAGVPPPGDPPGRRPGPARRGRTAAGAATEPRRSLADAEGLRRRHPGQRFQGHRRFRRRRRQRRRAVPDECRQRCARQHRHGLSRQRRARSRQPVDPRRRAGRPGALRRQARGGRAPGLRRGNPRRRSDPQRRRLRQPGDPAALRCRPGRRAEGAVDPVACRLAGGPPAQGPSVLLQRLCRPAGAHRRAVAGDRRQALDP
ncbi:hypothetical protein HMPREF1030_04748, partial [Pseudomonas aeruginosa]